ncbi:MULTISPECIES: hypothetical protein [Bacillus]|uniref:Uncharacterized protein n=2 Tax=Bacillus TaxID=1386 RepID=A0A0M4FZT9_9BACI|nr:MULTISPECIES: hypothetical protein [Bacillus]ALC83225.1 hypothetical protein AM592_17910 [Bacillus gobiensis]MBP1084223.1 hypothetical protein [Bacillus capparidis]MED1094662.1 hypothetical protein [Bacillus capparidis]
MIKTPTISLLIKTPIIGIFKHSVFDDKGNIVTTIKTKLSLLKAMYYFMQHEKTLYYAIDKISKKIITQEILIFNNEDKRFESVRKKPIYKKKQIFKELVITHKSEKYNVQFTLAEKQFFIKDEKNKLIAEGELVSSLFLNLFYFRAYRVKIDNDILIQVLRAAILKGIQLLD